MAQLLFLMPLFPLFGAIILGLAGRSLRPKSVALIGVGSVGLAALTCLFCAADFNIHPPLDHVMVQTLWTWMNVGGFSPAIGLRLDSLSLVMCLVVTFVGLLIHLYSVAFMAGDEGYSRFFSYLNLFIASMLILVLADDLLFLYLGWEGVGVCSYLLIGFWYRDSANGRAARKAFLVTRIGDTSMAIGLFALFWRFGTLQIQALLSEATRVWNVGGSAPILVSALLLGGAIGKSAQIPLQTWLPDAMAGPTPVSALIHAATMVTAGVYLIARTHTLFSLAPPVQTAVALIGTATLLLAGCSALVQSDLKRILAYSTMSQIGYMFLALGVGAWSAAIFHFMIHAFFKATLFLGAGAVIYGLKDGHALSHDISKIGGLRKRMPAVFWTFLIGSCSLSALPLVTAGFYSKDLILKEAYGSPNGGLWLWSFAALGAFVTALYTFRMVFAVFFGPAKHWEIIRRPGPLISIPLIVLAALSIFGGVVPLTGFVEWSLPRSPSVQGSPVITLLGGTLPVLGLVFAYFFYYLKRPPLRLPDWIERLWLSGWGFDGLYDCLFVKPICFIAQINQGDFVDLFFNGIASVLRRFYRIFSLTQTGNLRWYASVMVGGAAAAGLVVLMTLGFKGAL